MGCNNSKQAATIIIVDYSQFECVEDSVRVLVEHSKKVSLQHGETPQGYIPRPQHPLLYADADDDDLTLEESTLTAAESADSSAVHHSNFSSQ